MLRRLKPMHTQLSAVAEPYGSRADYWNDLISSKVIGMDLRFDEPLNIRNEVLTGNVGPVHVTEALCSPGEATRTTRHIRENDPDSYTLVMHNEGTAISEHRGRQSRYQPGDLGLMDFSHPLRWTYTKRRMVLVSFPKALSPLRRDEMGQLTGKSFPGTRGAGALVSTLVRQLPRHLDTGEGAGGARIGCAVLDLVNAAFAAQLEREDVLPSSSRTTPMPRPSSTAYRRSRTG
jgi:hypothetical protein